MPGPIPLCYGEGKTPAQAVQDCQRRFESDKVGQAWNGLIDWNDGLTACQSHT